MVSSDDFRQDLYYRLNVVRIALPPLRERQGDIPLLVKYFVDHFCERYTRPPMCVDAGLMEFLQAHRWPGNVRELRNCVESMVVLSNSDQLTVADVPPTTRKSARPHRPHFELPDGFTLAEVTQAAITQALERCDGNRTHAANKLDISVRTLQRKLSRRQADAA
jgi:DNA-binding NtrC family response regulator